MFLIITFYIIEEGGGFIFAVYGGVEHVGVF